MKYWRRQWQPTPVLLPVKSHGWRSLVGCSPWGRKESDTTGRLHFHFSLSRIGEGNGNPLQCSCLENPRDGGAQWAAIYGIAQSRTWLKRLSSSSSKCDIICLWSLLVLGFCLLGIYMSWFQFQYLWSSSPTSGPAFRENLNLKSAQCSLQHYLQHQDMRAT